MKISNAGYLLKGISLILGGAVIAFFPGIISWLFYVIGIIIIASCIISLISSIGSGNGMMISTSIGGIIVGVLIMFLPEIVSASIPVIGGLIFGFSALKRIFTALSSSVPEHKRKANGITGALLLVIALILILNPFEITRIACVIIGLVMAAFGVFNLYVAHVIKQRNENSSSGVININNFTINDD